MDMIKQIAASTVDALKSQPLVLGLLLINIMFVAAIFYSSTKNSERYERQLSR